MSRLLAFRATGFWCSKSRRGGGQEASLLLLVGFVILPGWSLCVPWGRPFAHHEAGVPQGAASSVPRGTWWLGPPSWPRRRQRRDHCNRVPPPLIPCVKPVTTALEFRGRIRFIYYFYLLLKPHFTSPLKQFPSVSQEASTCFEPPRPPLLWSLTKWRFQVKSGRADVPLLWGQSQWGSGRGLPLLRWMNDAPVTPACYPQHSLWGSLGCEEICPFVQVWVSGRGLDQPTRGIPWCQDCQALRLVWGVSCVTMLPLAPSFPVWEPHPMPPLCTEAETQWPGLLTTGPWRHLRHEQRALEPHLFLREHRPRWERMPGPAVASLLLQAASYLHYFTSECIL